MLTVAGAMLLSACQPGEKYEDAPAAEMASAETTEVSLVAPPREADTAPQARTAEATAPSLSPRADADRGETAAPSITPTPAEEAGRYRPAPPPPAPLAPVAKIAYAFGYVLSVPEDRGAELMSRHEYACATAGPGLCQVVSAQADWTGRNPGGRLELRGQPDWINRFRAGLAVDAQNAGGRLEEAVTQGEDVTRGIDAAQTGAKTTASLAERIRELQARRGGTMAQRLEIERELAQLQRLQDEQQIRLRALNDRVQSARLTIEYRQGGVMAADSPTRPVARALQDAFGLSMGMLGFLITAGSVMLPIVAIGGVVWWAAVRRKRQSASV